MGIYPEVIIYVMTAGMCLSSVTENKEGSANNKCDNISVEQTANLGGTVTIYCKYPRKEENSTKMFCRVDEKFHCIHLVSTYQLNNTKVDRFSLTDNKQQQVFTVIISTITLEDGGKYQCATVRLTNSSAKCHAQIHLNILNWDDITPLVTLHHATGESAQMNCPYRDSPKNNDKVLCKGQNPFNCAEVIHITEQDREVVDGRFSIRDNRRKKNFYVYIKNLSTADSGTYWCVSDRTRQHNEYNKIHLSVVERHIKTIKSRPPALQATNPPISADEPSDIDAGVIVGGVCLALLVMALVVLVLYRHELPWRQGRSSEQRTNTGHNREGSEGDHHYEEIQMWNQQTRQEIGQTGDALPSIYATVNPHTDQLHYASVTLQKDTVSTNENTLPNTNKSSFSACDYSCVRANQGGTDPPASEHTLYSTVTKPN